MIPVSVCLQVVVITLLKIVLIGGFSSHLRLSLHNYKVECITRSECRLHSIDPSIHLEMEHIADKDYDDKNNNSGIRGKRYMNYNLVKTALLKYKEIYGNMLVKHTFIIPTNSSDFPEEFWEIRLGGHVNMIRNNNAYAENKDELIALGFDFEYQKFTFDEIMRALLRFKQIFGDLLVPKLYVISPDDTDYPEEVRGMNLGTCVGSIRKGSYLKKKEELLAIGFVYSVRKRFDYETVRIATFKYRELHYGSTKVPLKYKIPIDSTWYPEETWGMSLGSLLYTIRSGKKWPDKYSELFS
jgi:hypothetical protein